MQVPDVEHPHRLQTIEVKSIAFYTAHDRGAAFRPVKSVLTSGHINTRRQALEIPFPRSDGGFVKIIQIENDVALRGAVQTEIIEVGVAVYNYFHSGDRRIRQVRGHYNRRTTEESERRFGHATHSKGNEVLEPSSVAAVQQVKRARPILRRFPASVGLSRDTAAQCFALGAALGPWLVWVAQVQATRRLRFLHDVNAYRGAGIRGCFHRT